MEDRADIKQLRSLEKQMESINGLVETRRGQRRKDLHKLFNWAGVASDAFLNPSFDEEDEVTEQRYGRGA